MLRERTRRISYGIQCLPQPALFVCLGMLGCLAGAISAIDTPDLELKKYVYARYFLSVVSRCLNGRGCTTILLLTCNMALASIMHTVWPKMEN